MLERKGGLNIILICDYYIYLLKCFYGYINLCYIYTYGLYNLYISIFVHYS